MKRRQSLVGVVVAAAFIVNACAGSTPPSPGFTGNPDADLAKAKAAVERQKLPT